MNAPVKTDDGGSERPLRPVDLPEIPLPASWPEHAKTGALAAFTLSHFVITALRGWGHSVQVPRVRIEIEWKRRESELARLREQLRLLQARFGRLDGDSRPKYTDEERFDVLAMREACGWSIRRTAREFIVCPATVARWFKKQDSDSLVAQPGPVNKFSEQVTFVVQRLRRFYPALGYRKIAHWLCGAGLQISASTVWRKLQQKPVRRPPPAKKTEPTESKARGADEAPRVHANKPGELWHAEMSVAPTSFGLAVSWCPFAFPPVFPFCFHVVGVKHHFSRRVLTLVPFKKQPTAAEVAAVLDLAVERQGTPPRHIVSDKGSQFWNCKAQKAARVYDDWLTEHGVRPRFGAVGQHGSIAIIERFWRTLKQQGTRRMLVPCGLDAFTDELDIFREWFNSRRPHSALAGATADDVAAGRCPPKQRAQLETRPRYPLAAGDIESGNVWRVENVEHVELSVTGFRGRRHLPDVRLVFAA